MLLMPTKFKPPEQEELEIKQQILEGLEAEYVGKQLEYATYASEVTSFRNRYYLRVGNLYARLDALRAEIKELQARLEPKDEAAKQAAEQARRQAEETIDEMKQAEDGEAVSFHPSADLKQSYRQAAKLIHPDRANNEEDRELRDRLMAHINAAYTAGDIDTIHEIVEQYRNQLDTADADDIGTKLIRTIRNIAQTRSRIASLNQAIAELMSSEWFKLKSTIEQGETNGEDPLGRLAEQIYEELLQEQDRFNSLVKITTTGPEVQTKAEVQAEFESGPAESQSFEPTTEAPSFRPEGLIHRTERGEWVRSKSEAIIANIMLHIGLDYRYEYPIEGHIQPGIRRPDFVMFDANHKPIIWEHLGMLDKPDYCERWEAKLAWYKVNGFTSGTNLFVTSEESDGLDSQLLRKTAEHIRTLIA